MATLLLAASVAAAPLGCAATEAEESGELGQSSEAIIAGQEGILRASGYVPAIGLSRIYSSPGAKHSVVPGWGGCTGTLIDDHTVLTSGHCVCAPNDAACVNKNSGTITSSDPRDQFRIFVRTASGADVVYRIPVTKWALVGKEADNGAYVNDIALVRLAYRVPGALASPLTYGAWGAGDTTDYGTFGFGPGPGNGPVGVKRVGLHGGTFTYAGDQELMVGGGDSGGPTLANWSPFVGYLNTKIIAVSSAYLDNPHRVYSAAPANHAVWIEATRSGWDAAGLPLPYPFKTYIGSNLPASNTNLTAKYTIDGALFQDGFDIGGVHHAKGIFVPWDPEVRFDLSVKDLNQVNGYGTFHACVGMTDVAAHCAGASTWFLVSADGKDLTGYIEKHVGETATCFDLPVAGFDQLVLHTGSDFNECNQPAWVNAYLTNQAVPAVQGQSITWTNVFSASASGSLLSCSAGGGWSAGASSVEQIAAGDGYLAFSTAEANLSKMAGLSHGDGNQGYGDIDYAIFLRADGIVGVYEGGWDQGTFGPYMAGDSFRVEVSGGQVRYRRNGQVFYSSATPPTYPLVVDTSLEHAGATVLDARIASCVAGDTDCMPAELWTNVGYAMSNGGSLTRTPGGGWHAGASSSSAISAGDGYAQFSTAEASTSKMAGLSHGDSNRGYGDIDYAIFLRADGVLGVYEGGWDQGTFGSYA
ncbi:MAG TPA: NPCBM/NEW2 domain-containing protein, partial [Polyangiaceae bacterium]|nr:NPCBM/NEW2 domain-containing protein [Polyangiaceae bacterium]